MTRSGLSQERWSGSSWGKSGATRCDVVGDVLGLVGGQVVGLVTELAVSDVVGDVVGEVVGDVGEEFLLVIGDLVVMTVIDVEKRELLYMDSLRQDEASLSGLDVEEEERLNKLQEWLKT